MKEREPDGRLASAAARSPELAAMLARRRPEPARRYLRLAGVVGGAAAGVAGIWIASASRLPARERPSEPAEEVDSSHYLAPVRTHVEGGDEVAPFAGFALSVETEPPGALVTIRGVPRGEAPVLANLDCRPGEPIDVQAERAGAGNARREVACRADALVKVTLRLGP